MYNNITPLVNSDTKDKAYDINKSVTCRTKANNAIKEAFSILNTLHYLFDGTQAALTREVSFQNFKNVERKKVLALMRKDINTARLLNCATNYEQMHYSLTEELLHYEKEFGVPHVLDNKLEMLDNPPEYMKYLSKYQTAPPIEYNYFENINDFIRRFNQWHQQQKLEH